MKYKVTNRLHDTEDGKSFEIVAIFNTFENMADKVISDLNSLWNGTVPFPFNMTVELVDDAEPSGLSLIEGGKVVAHNEDKSSDEMVELYSLMMKGYFGDKFLQKGGKA